MNYPPPPEKPGHVKANPYAATQAAAVGYPPQQATNTPGLIGFILSLLGLVGIGCVLMSVAGIIFSFVGLKREPKGLATAGLIIGILGLLIWGAFIAIWITMVAVATTTVASIGPMAVDQMENYMPLMEANQHLVRQWSEEGMPDTAAANEILDGHFARWDNQIRYELNEARGYYRLRSAGPNGVFDSPGDGGDDAEDDISIGPFHSMGQANWFHPNNLPGSGLLPKD